MITSRSHLEVLLFHHCLVPRTLYLVCVLCGGGLCINRFVLVYDEQRDRESILRLDSILILDDNKAKPSKTSKFSCT